MSDQGGWGQGGQGGAPPPGGFGPPQGNTPPAGGFGPTNANAYTGGPGSGAGEPSGMAILALVLGLISWFFSSILTAIPGAIIGKIELGKIERGESSAAGKTFAEIGYWASVVHIALVVVATVGFCCIFGGMALFGLSFGAFNR